jgi:hypothetical protein
MCGTVGSFKSLFLDHIDNNNNNNDLDNFQLLCRSCNAKKNHRGKAKPENESAEIESPKQSEEVRLKKEYRPKFCKWLECQVTKYERLAMKQAILSGAKITGASSQTITRYLEEECSDAGFYQVVEVDSKKYVEFKKWWKTG